MAEEDRRPASADFEQASRVLLRRLSATSDQMAAAEPGTDDFLTAYNESQRLRQMYRHVRETWEVPAEVWSDGAPSATLDTEGDADLGID